MGDGPRTRGWGAVGQGGNFLYVSFEKLNTEWFNTVEVERMQQIELV